MWKYHDFIGFRKIPAFWNTKKYVNGYGSVGRVVTSDLKGSRSNPTIANCSTIFVIKLSIPVQLQRKSTFKTRKTINLRREALKARSSNLDKVLGFG